MSVWQVETSTGTIYESSVPVVSKHQQHCKGLGIKSINLVAPFFNKNKNAKIIFYTTMKILIKFVERYFLYT